MRLRNLFFWTHLSLGLTVGLVVFFLAGTGLILVFEPRILSAAESGLRTLSGPNAGHPRISLDELVHKAEDSRGLKVSGLTVYSDADRSVEIQLGNSTVFFMDPYSGGILGPGANGLRRFFNAVTGLHRWFGFDGPRKEMAQTVKGIGVILFGFSILTGLCLWWPKAWTAQVFKVAGIPQWRFVGKQRYFNWHNALGFWFAPWLLVFVLTGLVMAYPWANDAMGGGAKDLLKSVRSQILLKQAQAPALTPPL